MIFYLTFNDAPSGVYSSQVIDVVKLLNSRARTPVRLVAFISLRTYFEHRRIIRQQLADAIIVPMFPSVKNWRWNRFLLYALAVYHRPVSIIARSIFATNLAFLVREKKLTKKVAYDGRGAIAAEWKEYNLSRSGVFADNISVLERDAIGASDFSIAVSHRLIEYWKREYNYSSAHHLIIPCTLDSTFFNSNFSDAALLKLKESLHYQSSDIILIYSGSSAGWQSFAILSQQLGRWLRQNKQIKVLFLAKPGMEIRQLMDQFPGQVNCFWVHSSVIQHYLMMGDYGLLIREQSVTNEVSSPVKFAEYLSCGLSVIISENLGDYTQFVSMNDCGIVLNASDSKGEMILQPVNAGQKEKNKSLANLYFRKDSRVNSQKFDELLQKLY